MSLLRKSPPSIVINAELNVDCAETSFVNTHAARGHRREYGVCVCVAYVCQHSNTKATGHIVAKLGKVDSTRKVLVIHFI